MSVNIESNRNAGPPGLKLRQQAEEGQPPSTAIFEPDAAPYSLKPRNQPFFKLHGSSNWKVPGGEDLLILGGAKSLAINRVPLLKWYHDNFRDFLLAPNTRLLVIGYGFGDSHVNEQIKNAVEQSGLKIFIIDPIGVDIVDKNRGLLIHDPDVLAKAIWPKVIGASRRSLREIFENDKIEHAKVMRFFEP